MTPRAKGALVLGGLAALGFLLTMKPTAFPQVTLSPPGFRRARQAEVTPEMRSAAVRALTLPLGLVWDHGDFAIGVETHSDEARGPHKGASVFLPSSPRLPFGERERVAQLARAYLDLWHRSGPVDRRTIIDTIWSAIAHGAKWTGDPWSAAFVSHVVGLAAPGALFPSLAHANYVAQAIQGFGRYAFVPAAAAVALLPGDVILKPRPGGSPPTSEQLTAGGYPSHGDVVVGVTPGAYLAIGGNKLEGQVAIESYARDPITGALLPPAFGALQLSPAGGVS